MTPKSRPGGGGAHRGRDTLGRIILVAAWHALCIPFTTMGCFAFWPTPYLEENEAPSFFKWSRDDGALVSVDGVNDTFFVIALDPDLGDEETLQFIWQAGPYLVDPREESADADGDTILFYSLIDIPYDPDLDGEVLSCTVIDEGGADDRMSWPLEVL